MRNRVKDYLTGNTVGNILTVIIGVLLYIGLSNYGTVRDVLNRGVKIIAPFIYAFGFAYILNNPIKWFEINIFYNFKHRKTLSITAVYVIVLFVVGALFTAVLPQLGKSIMSIADSLPDYLTSLSGIASDLMEKYHLDAQLALEVEQMWTNIVKSITDFVLGIIPKILNFSISIGNIIIKSLMMLIASIYMLTGKERLTFQIKKLVYAYFPIEKADKIIEIAQRSNRIFSGFISGKIIDSIIIGIIAFIGMIFIYSPYAVLIGVIVGVTNVIPFFGPFIGAIPSIFILLMVNPMTAVIFAVFILVLQQVDGNIIGPKILGDSTGLSAIWVLVAIVLGNGLFGVAGMLIGVPTFAVLYSLMSDNITNRLNSKGIAVDSQTKNISFEQIGFDEDAK